MIGMRFERIVGALVIACVLLSIATVALDVSGKSAIGRFVQKIETGSIWEAFTPKHLKLVAEYNATGVRCFNIKVYSAYLLARVSKDDAVRIYSSSGKGAEVEFKGSEASINVSNDAFILELPHNASIVVRVENAMAVVRGEFSEVRLNATRCGVRIDVTTEKLVVYVNNAYLEAHVTPSGNNTVIEAHVSRAMAAIKVKTLGVYGIEKDVKYLNAMVKVSIKEPETPKYKVSLVVRARECMLGIEAGE